MQRLIRLLAICVFGAALISCRSDSEGSSAPAKDPSPGTEDDVPAVLSCLDDRPFDPAAISSMGEQDRALWEKLIELDLCGKPSTDLKPVVPDDNALVKLGATLFYSRTLSADYDVSCGSCHDPRRGGSDALSLSVGVASSKPWIVGLGRFVDKELDKDPNSDCGLIADLLGHCGPNMPRNSLTLFNAALYEKHLLWDGRVERFFVDGVPYIRTPDSGNGPDLTAGETLLSAQAKFPVVNANEMRGFGLVEHSAPNAYRELLVRRLKGEADPDIVTPFEASLWLSAFRQAFPDVNEESLITYENIQKALDQYMRSQIFIDTPWSDYVAGNLDAITEEQKRGAYLFYTSLEEGGYGCASCHSGDFMTDEDFHNVGFPQIGRGQRIDGRDFGRSDVSRQDSDLYSFRTPSLLNVAATAPYGHAGTFSTLKSALQYHVNPEALSLIWAEDFLVQFIGLDILFRYPKALFFTAEAIQSPNFSVDKLPLLAVPEPDIDALVAFLEAQTDRCVAEPECIKQWIPGDYSDPDGNLLVYDRRWNMGALSASIGTYYPLAPVEIDYGSSSSRATFMEIPDCSAVAFPVSGSSGFTVLEGNDIGVPLRHVMPKEAWLSAGRSFAPEPTMTASGVSAAHLNNDCLPDLIMTTGGASGIQGYLGTGTGFVPRSSMTSLPVPLEYISSIGVADINGDYSRELVLGNLHSGTGDTFFNQKQVLVLNQATDGNFDVAGSIPMYRNTYGISFGDVDGDQDLDLFLAHWGNNSPSTGPALWENNLDAGTLTPEDGKFKTGVKDGVNQQWNFTPAFWDIDGDGWQDLTIVSDYGTSYVFRNNAGEGYVEWAGRDGAITDENGMGSAVGDYDNDGRIDWFVTSIFDEDGVAEGNWGVSGNRLYRNVSDSSGVAFQDVTAFSGVRNGAWGWGACFADFNNDGWLDIFHENGFGYIPEYVRDDFTSRMMDAYANVMSDFLFTAPRLFINNAMAPGELSFRDAGGEWGVTTPTNSRGLVCLDYDRDGDIDVITLEHSGGARLYQNNTGNAGGHRFVTVRLVGEQPNTDAVGAKIWVWADTDGDSVVDEGKGERQVRAVMLNSNFNSQNLPDLHFGLGHANVIQKMRIEWPGDSVPLECVNVPVNRFIVVDQRDKSCP